MGIELFYAKNTASEALAVEITMLSFFLSSNRFRPQRCNRDRRVGESGQIAVMLVVLFPVLLALVGLVVDGGIMFVNYRLGRATVDSAALAAATMLNEEVFEDSNEIALKNDDAYETAIHYADLNGQGRVAVTGVTVSENTVYVYGTVVSPTLFMRILAIDHVTFNLSAEAELTYGITEEYQ